MTITRFLTLLAILGTWAVVVAAYADAPRSSNGLPIPNAAPCNTSRCPAVGGVQFDSRISDLFTSDKPQSARFKWHAGGTYQIEVTTTGGIKGRFGNLSPSEL